MIFTLLKLYIISNPLSPFKGIALEYSTDLGHTWLPVLSQCAVSDVDCVRFHDDSVYTSDVYSQWQRVTVHLPQHTQ